MQLATEEEARMAALVGSHRRWRSDFENDVLVPEKKKEEIPDFVRVLPEGVGSTQHR